MPDLMINLKFEIEVLCKTLNIEISSLKPGNQLTQNIQLRMFGLKPGNDAQVEEIKVNGKNYFSETLVAVEIGRGN